MPRHVLLNNVDHAALRIDTGHGAALGDEVLFAPTFPGEFRDVQAHYPIVFAATTAGLRPVAMFGLQEGRNLFLDGARWDATYLPLAMQRRPFRVGATGDELLIHVDLDDPRVGTQRGEALFREHGGTTDYLDRVRSVLLALHEGMAATPAFVGALLQHRLLEPFVLDATLDDGTHIRLDGFHTIAEERLRALEGDALAQLHRAGHLEPLYMALASLSRLRDLIERANRRAGTHG